MKLKTLCDATAELFTAACRNVTNKTINQAVYAQSEAPAHCIKSTGGR